VEEVQSLARLVAHDSRPFHTRTVLGQATRAPGLTAHLDAQLRPGAMALERDQ